MNENILDTSIEYLKGVGPKKADLLKKELGIYHFRDLLGFYPFRYVDRTKFYKINEITEELPYIQIRGKLGAVQKIGANRAARLVASFHDETGKIDLIWFRGITWIAKFLKPNQEYVAFGKPNYYKGRPNLPHPELETIAEFQNSLQSSLEPVYHSSEKLKTRGLGSKGIAKLTEILLKRNDLKILEFFSEGIIGKYQLMDRAEAIRQIHFPENPKVLNKATARLKFEELFMIQMTVLNQKVQRKKLRGHSFTIVGDHFNKFYKEVLPFELTGAQKKVLKEIRQDVRSDVQMNRLLQGDVGSGKTMVAFMSMLIAIDNGYQACLMAPTEILANQHYETLSQLSQDLDIKVGLLTGSTKTKERKELQQLQSNGELHILIGTHALIEEKVTFKNLGIAIIDEQHRFGVAQRSKLWSKNTIPPHVLVMTATPIPRTLAMTLYGDLDVSIIDELPPGRKEIKTIHRFDSSRLRVFGFMKEQIKKGGQIYVVYPLIQESETLDYKDLMDGYESICRAFPQPEYQVSIVHGKMKSDAKDFEVNRFVKGETQIMVATTVIEVGVHIPNASVMVIESAERFGLSQLHQLRGRVGRGSDQSFCVLMTGYKLSDEGRKRMNAMIETNDGFKISELDLKLRGPGDIQGLQQSGVLDLRLADLALDGAILKEARLTATEVLNEDADLMLPKHQGLRRFLIGEKKSKGDWSRIA
ncbi:ATP-dependent DNA helicase RecG [bacterium AH-315-C07]|nr:ATP-dependent DNA helicase RecG [bacterium AH-315-C07]